MGIIVIKAFVEARDNLEEIRADILSDENKDKITSEVRQKIIDNNNDNNNYNPLLLETDLPECIRLYITALEGLNAADKKLRLFYKSFANDSFLQDKIAIYDRFIKAKNKLEECLDDFYLRRKWNIV